MNRSQVGAPSTWLRSFALRQPNPIWLREMVQASRLTRTPLILMTVTILLTVITCSVGGVASSSVGTSRLS